MSNGIGKEFMHMTKYQYLAASDQMKGIQQPPLELPYDRSKSIIALPKPEDIVVKNADVRRVIESRTSIRNYSKKPLTLEELSYLLWCTQDVKEVIPGTATYRNVPSAGARHSLETYLLINNITGLLPGVYRFLASKHKLMEVNLQPDIADKITEACLGQNIIKLCDVVFIWSAVAYRMKWRYGERGYRYMHLDAGHVCQNLYLSAESIDCGACAIAAFSDDDINDLLSLDGDEEFVIYLAAAGKK